MSSKEYAEFCSEHTLSLKQIEHIVMFATILTQKMSIRLRVRVTGSDPQNPHAFLTLFDDLL